MPIVAGAIAPHGFPIIPELSDDAEGAMATRVAMTEMGRRFRDAGVEVVVIAGPHGFRVRDHICLADVATAAGRLTWNGRMVEQQVPVDGALTDAIYATARDAGIAVALGGFAGNRRDQSVQPLDWGTLTPLWFVGHDRNVPGSGDVLAPVLPPVGPAAVIASPSRTLPREKMVAFGRSVADAAAADPRRIAFIASCDWGHCHRADGPYGYHEASARIDAIVVEATKRNDLASLISLSDEDVQNAAIDGLWQALMLAGVQERRPMASEVLSYEAPTYYGMLVACFSPT